MTRPRPVKSRSYKVIMHFNKPGSKHGTPWTVHFRGTCHLVQEIRCLVPMISEFKPEKKTNPRAFFTAQAYEMIVSSDGVAVIK
jgi:hypothetical protein